MGSTATTNHEEENADSEGDSSVIYFVGPSRGRVRKTRPPRSNENITRIDSDLYQAAVEGDFDRFIGLDDIETLLTPNKNTILHIHLTSTITETTQSVSQPFVRQIRSKFRHLIHKNVETAVVSKPFVQEILRKCGGLVLLPNSKGETPLHLAARYGHSTISKLLIECAKSLPHDEIESGIEGDKKLTRATTKNSEDTALHEAVRHNHIGVVEILLRMDPDLSKIANKAKETPLYLAAERQYTPIVQKILEVVESPSYEGPNGRTALHAAVIHSDLGMVVDLLKDEHLRAAVKHPDNNHWVPLYYAVKMGNVILTELLLKQDKNTAYVQDKKGCTALHIAARCGHSLIVEMIIRYCPDCSELVDDAGCNALHHAVAANRHYVVDRIMRNLSLSNLYNEETKGGDTPLHQLADSRIKSNDLMFHRRVDKLALNRKDETALDVAYATVESSPLTKQSIINRLEKAGAKRSQRLEDTKSKNKDTKLAFTEEAKESHLIVATLIATVSFAAAFTLPGGTFQDGELKGSPILRDKASFKAFIVSNTIAMIMAASAAFIYLFSPLKKVKWLDYYFSEAAFSFTVVAVATMIVAFVTGMYAVLGSSSIGIAVITVGLSFFLVFKQVLRMSFGAYPFLAIMKSLGNVILFPFIRFGARPFGMFFLLFKRLPDKEDPQAWEPQTGWDITCAD